MTGLTSDINGAFLASGGIHAVRALAAGSLPETVVAGERVGAPIARPAAVLCIGMNYAAHAAESGTTPPDAPVRFHKHPNTVIGPDDPIVIPRNAVKTDWEEVELGVVIGTRASYLDSPDDLSAVIAGYVLSNDVSERAFQLEVSGGQWSKGKSCASFNPLGPWLVTSDEVGDPAGLRLASWVNEEPGRTPAPPT